MVDLISFAQTPLPSHSHLSLSFLLQARLPACKGNQGTLSLVRPCNSNPPPLSLSQTTTKQQRQQKSWKRSNLTKRPIQLNQTKMSDRGGMDVRMTLLFFLHCSLNSRWCAFVFTNSLNCWSPPNANVILVHFFFEKPSPRIWDILWSVCSPSPSDNPAYAYFIFIFFSPHTSPPTIISFVATGRRISTVVFSELTRTLRSANAHKAGALCFLLRLSSSSSHCNFFPWSLPLWSISLSRQEFKEKSRRGYVSTKCQKATKDNHQNDKAKRHSSHRAE